MVSPINHGLHGLKPRITRIFILATCYLLLATHCYAQSRQYIRVAIVQDASSLRLKIKGPYQVIDSVNKKELYHGRNLNTTVTVYKGGILLGDRLAETNKVFIKLDNPDALIINGRMFRGDIQLVKKDNSHLLAVNHIELEDYIKGILYHESSHYWPIDALKAQAIVCRTFAFYQMRQNRAQDYDITSDIYSQVYGGRTSERYRTNRVVDETKGYVLTYQSKILPAYYHSTCAGHTEDASLLWNIDIAPLKGVPCSFCRDSPHSTWHYVLSLEEIEDKLLKAGFKISGIKDVLILGRDKSSRITELKILSAKKDVKILAKDFRELIGVNIIRSTNFKVEVRDGDVVFEGLGWGHGVGLCQWGAYFMAKQGYKYNEILKYYYPQTEVSQMY